MGQAIMHAVAGSDDLQLASVWVRDEQRVRGLGLPQEVLCSSDFDTVASAADVVVDFSLPEATSGVVAAVVRHGKPLVCGVSGLTDEHMAEFDLAARTVAVVYDRNMSLGIAVLENLVRQAAAALGSDFEIEIQETHHVHKIDAPSGTALKLGDAISEVHGSDANEIRYEVERRGEVLGDHAVILSSATERLTLGHSVATRQVFADGALRAARWIVDRAPGRYPMRDVLAGGAKSLRGGEADEASS